MKADRPAFVERDGHYVITGPLVFATVLDLLPMSARWRSARGSVVVDLGGVTRADSAGLALLVEWLRAAHAADRPLSFTHVPAALKTLIEVSDLGGVIPLAA